MSLGLTSCDGETFEVDRNLVKIIAPQPDLFVYLEPDHIRFTTANGAAVGKSLQWFEHCKKHPRSPVTKTDRCRSDNIQPCDEAFLAVTTQTLSAITIVAWVLGISELLDLCCKKTSNMIKNCTPDQIRERFNMQDEFTGDG